MWRRFSLVRLFSKRIGLAGILRVPGLPSHG
jgi:hypothetical protein